MRLLSKDPYIAKEAANLLLDRLVTLRPGQATPFEAAMLADDRLMRDISTIANDPSPACIWRKRGRTAHLFRFLASRFIGAPDSVGACESIHAQWKWLEINRHNIKFKLLNALLRLRTYVTSYGSFPPFEDLRCHIDALESFDTTLYQSIRDGGQVAPSLVRDTPYLERFNLRGEDLDLIHGGSVDDSDEDVSDVKNVDVAWGNYVRFLLAPHNVYCLTALQRQTFFYVAENKSVAYRDAPKQGETIGRPISLIWLESLVTKSHIVMSWASQMRSSKQLQVQMTIYT